MSCAWDIAVHKCSKCERFGHLEKHCEQDELLRSELWWKFHAVNPPPRIEDTNPLNLLAVIAVYLLAMAGLLVWLLLR